MAKKNNQSVILQNHKHESKREKNCWFFYIISIYFFFANNGNPSIIDNIYLSLEIHFCVVQLYHQFTQYFILWKPNHRSHCYEILLENSLGYVLTDKTNPNFSRSMFYAQCRLFSLLLYLITGKSTMKEEQLNDIHDDR